MKIEENTFICGDCMDVLRSTSDKSVDLCLTDPPYGVGLAYKSYFDSEENWFRLMDAFIPEARRVSKMVIMPSCRIKALPWIYKNHAPDWLICWYKGSPGHHSAIGFNDWEPLLVYGRRNTIPMHDYLAVTNGEIMGANGHPCPKPIGWARWLIERASLPGDLILDPFCGSGTTALASYLTGRRFVCIDREPDYIAIAERRYSELTAQEELFGSAPKDKGSRETAYNKPQPKMAEQMDLLESATSGEPGKE